MKSRQKQLTLTYHQKNAEGDLVKVRVLTCNLAMQMNLRDRIIALLPVGHTLELDTGGIDRAVFSRGNK